MRCKRCGELLEPTDSRCPVCGKTVAPPRRKAPAQRPSEANIKLPQLDKFTHAYSADAARSRMLQLATIAAVLVSVALLVMVFAGVGDLKDAVQDLKRTADAQLQAIQNQSNVSIPTPTEGEPQMQSEPVQEDTDEPDDSQDTASLPLSQWNLMAQLTLYRGSNGAYACADMDLADYNDQAAAWVSTVRDGTSRQTNVAWILEGSGDRMDVSLRDSYGGADAQVDIDLSWQTQGDTFSSLGSPVCIWEYRVQGGSWESVPTEYLTPVGGGCEVKITADQLTELLVQNSQMELRCLVSLTHPAGGSVKMLLDGITFDSTGLVVSGDLLD